MRGATDGGMGEELADGPPRSRCEARTTLRDSGPAIPSYSTPRPESDPPRADPGGPGRLALDVLLRALVAFYLRREVFGLGGVFINKTTYYAPS
jgi:hypothetical protein